MTFYRWMMDRGAGILFFASLIIFVVSFVGSYRGPGTYFPSDQGPQSDRLLFMLSLASAVGTAISHSALTFFGACFLYRLDVAWGSARK